MKKLSFHHKLMSLLLIHFGIFLYAVIFHWNFLYLLIAYLLGKFIGYLGNEIGLHRLWSHRSFTTDKWKEYILHVLSVPLLCGSSIVYAAIHRQHHAYSDTEKDPHITNSKIKTFFYVRDDNFTISPKIVVDLIKSPLHKWLHLHYFKINVIFLLFCLVVLGPLYTGWFISSIIVYNFFVIGMVNIYGHKSEYGVRNFDTNDNSTNNKWLQVWTWNHGLHNNHHKYPKNYKFVISKNEYDFPGWVIEKFFIKNT